MTEHPQCTVMMQDQAEVGESWYEDRKRASWKVKRAQTCIDYMKIPDGYTAFQDRPSISSRLNRSLAHTGSSKVQDRSRNLVQFQTDVSKMLLATMSSNEMILPGLHWM
jgi:hypothetical protein